MIQRQTIIHNVSDEPITVEQSDGSQIVVPAREKRRAELPSEVDSLIPPAQPHGPAASPELVASSFQAGLKLQNQQGERFRAASRISSRWSGYRRT
jgi:hypothetical protein